MELKRRKYPSALEQLVFFGDPVVYKLPCFTLGTDSLKIRHDLSWKLFLVLFVFESLQVIVKFKFGIKFCRHGLTHRIWVKLACINPNKWYTNVWGFAEESVINYSFTCKHPWWSTNLKNFLLKRAATFFLRKLVISIKIPETLTDGLRKTIK